MRYVLCSRLLSLFQFQPLSSIPPGRPPSLPPVGGPGLPGDRGHLPHRQDLRRPGPAYRPLCSPREVNKLVRDWASHGKPVVTQMYRIQTLKQNRKKTIFIKIFGFVGTGTFFYDFMIF